MNDTVDNTVTDAVNDTVDNTMTNNMDETVNDTVNNTVDDTMDNTVDCTFDDTVDDSVVSKYKCFKGKQGSGPEHKHGTDRRHRALKIDRQIIRQKERQND